MNKGRSFEKSLADPAKYDLPKLKRLSKSYTASNTYWLERRNVPEAEGALRKKAMVDAEIEKRGRTT